MKILIPFVLVLSVSGCVTKSTHTEGDREVQDQTLKAGEVVRGSIEAAKAAIADGKPEQAASLLEIGARAGGDIVENMKQQQDVHNPPENALPYSPENSAKARERSTKEHSESVWLKVLAIAGPVLSVGATLAGMPWLASIFPALTGKIGKWAQTGSQIIASVRAKAEASGGSIDVRDVLEIAKEKNVSAGIQGIVKKYADKLEGSMGHKFEMKLDEPAQPSGSAPAGQ